MRGAAFAGRYASDYLGSVLHHLSGVKTAFRTGESLYQDLG
jgi:hypothetical protein